MKKFFTAFSMCQSMFLSIPFPCKNWDESLRAYMLLFLPVIGLEIGIICYALSLIMNMLMLPGAVRAFILCAAPFILSGRIHLDGFMDVSDAVGSWRPIEKRRAILKDSHVGSFAVINAVLLILAQFAIIFSVINVVKLEIIIFIPIISRCCSALAVLNLKPIEQSQYAGRRKTPINIIVPLLTLCVSIGACYFVCGKYVLATVGCIVGYVLSLIKAYRCLDGINGDAAGYALTIGEVLGLLVLIFI